MAKSKKELEKDIAFLERQKFLEVYNQFNYWLRSIGFRAGNYRECSTSLDCNYSHYDKHIDSLYGVELYILESIRFSVRFLRDRYEHKFMFVGPIGAHSLVYSLDEFKEIVLNEVKKLRDEKLLELSKLSNI